MLGFNQMHLVASFKLCEFKNRSGETLQKIVTNFSLKISSTSAIKSTEVPLKGFKSQTVASINLYHQIPSKAENKAKELLGPRHNELEPLLVINAWQLL